MFKVTGPWRGLVMQVPSAFMLRHTALRAAFTRHSRAQSSLPGTSSAGEKRESDCFLTGRAQHKSMFAALFGAKLLMRHGLTATSASSGAGRPILTFRLAPSTTATASAAPPTLRGTARPGMRRAMSSGSKGSGDVIIYSSTFESVLRSISVGSVAQAGVFTIAGALISLHPAAASSSLLPGWTAGGRGALSGVLIGFGAAVVLGCKGFLGKQILKVATIPDCPEDINIYMLSFPFGTSVYRVPKNEFYVITAAFGEFDLDKEASGPAPILPVYVGGSVRQTLMIDVRGGFLDKNKMCEILVSVPQTGSGDWDAKADELIKKPFIPNKVKKDI